MVPGSLGRSKIFGDVGPERVLTQPPLLGKPSTLWNQSQGQGQSVAGSLEDRAGSLEAAVRVRSVQLRGQPVP